MKVAIIGYGSIGKRHAENIKRLGHEVFISDPSLGYDLPNRMALGDPGFLADAIIHAEPAGSRAPVNGLYKHFIEKPIALHSSDIPEGADAFIQVGYNLRFDESLIAWRKILPANIVSAKVWFSQRLDEWRPGRDYRTTPSAQKVLGGGILLEASHELDLIRWLFGEWDSVYATVRRGSDLDIDVEDCVAAIVTTVGGIVIQLSLDMVGSGYRRGVEVTTADGKVLTWTPDWKTDEDRNAMYLSEMRAFLDAVESGTLHPNAATLEDGIEALRLVEAIQRASDTGKTQWNGVEVEGSPFAMAERW